MLIPVGRELVNKFSWSFSAAADFEECRRKRYWSKYAMWGGWDASASPVQRKAYQFSKMDNHHTVQGQAVEEAVMWALRRKQEGRDVTPEEVYESAARPILIRSWKESKSGGWEQDPKGCCCLREHYYGEWDAESEKAVGARMKETVHRCIENFLRLVLPRLADVRPEDEVAVAKSGAPESFAWEGITIYAIPDYVYRRQGLWHIHDWKSGGVKPEHQDQLALYGLWAHQKHGIPPDQIVVFVEYLREGKVAMQALDESWLERARERIRLSVGDMAEYLVDGDGARNQPLPREDWELATDRGICARCNFFELCKPELDL